MGMNKTITVTSKGQTTLPAAVRYKLGLDKTGGILQISFDERKNELTISKLVSVAELSDKLSKYIQPGIKPLEDVDTYYQSNRRAA